MFEKYLIHPSGFRNVKSEGQTVGYEVQLRIPYYRGIPMSCVKEITLTVDDAVVPHESMSFLVKGEWLKYDELPTAVNHRWEMVDTITVFVDQKEGLKAGEHKVKGFVSLRISYQPHPNVGEDEKVITLEP
jgi:hypothetical protein